MLTSELLISTLRCVNAPPLGNGQPGLLVVMGWVQTDYSTLPSGTQTKLMGTLSHTPMMVLTSAVSLKGSQGVGHLALATTRLGSGCLCL